MHSESPSESMRGHMSLRHVGEGALDDSDSDDSESEHGCEGVPDDGHSATSSFEHHPSPGTAPPSARMPHSPYLHRSTTAHPSPLSKIALTSHQPWTEDERDDDDSPSPASTSGGSSDEDEDGDDDDEDRSESDRDARGGGGGDARRRMSSTSLARLSRRSSTKSGGRSRSSTVASLAVPATPQKALVKQESQSSIRTVTVAAGEACTPGGTLLRRDETIRDLESARAAMVRRSSTSLHQRAKSDAFSADFGGDGADDGGGAHAGNGNGNGTGGRTPSDRTKIAIREAEERLRGLAWGTMRERFEQYSDEVRFCLDSVFSLGKLTEGIG